MSLLKQLNMKFGHHDDVLLKAKQQQITESEGSSMRSNLSQIPKNKETLINTRKSEPKKSLLSSVVQNASLTKPEDEFVQRTNTENKAKIPKLNFGSFQKPDLNEAESKAKYGVRDKNLNKSDDDKFIQSKNLQISSDSQEQSSFNKQNNSSSYFGKILGRDAGKRKSYASPKTKKRESKIVFTTGTVAVSRSPRG